MHRNTYLLVSILAIVAALLVGINIGKIIQKPSGQSPEIGVTPTPTSVPTPVATIQTYTDTYCGFTIDYPSAFTVMENASGSAILNNTADVSQSISLTCQKNIPRPALTADRIETLILRAASGASVSAKLYHDTSAKDGTPVDEFIFRHPANGMDDYIAGFGTAFLNAIKTITILP